PGPAAPARRTTPAGASLGRASRQRTIPPAWTVFAWRLRCRSRPCPASRTATPRCRTAARNWSPMRWRRRPARACSTPAPRPAARPRTCSSATRRCGCLRWTWTHAGCVAAAASLREADATDVARWWDGVPFDAILLDAPCSATGVVRRQPDILLHRRASDVAALVQLQARLFDALWPTLARGGTLLY